MSASLATLPVVNRFYPDNASILDRFYADFDAPVWLSGLRDDARALLSKHGLPTQALERWKYTNLPRAVKADGLRPARAAMNITGFDAQNLSDMMDAGAVWLADMLQAAPEAPDYDLNAITHISNAFLRDGIVIDVPKGMVVDTPVRLDIISTDTTFTAPRIIIRLGEGAALTLIEQHEGAGHYWKNITTQIVVGRNARLHHYRMQNDNASGIYTQSTHIQMERDSFYEAVTMTSGAQLSRNQIHAVLDGENAQCNLNGINLLNGAQHGDTTMLVEHKAPHCNSRQFVRSVLDDQAHGVYQGKVLVHRPAQKTDGYQLSNALILSEGAEMDTKPELEIYADDVKCSHGATTGRLEETSLFYLRSRGIDEKIARALLIAAFLGEVLEHVADAPTRAAMQEGVDKWLARI